MVPDIGKNQLTIGNYKNMKIKFNVKTLAPQSDECYVLTEL